MADLGAFSGIENMGPPNTSGNTGAWDNGQPKDVPAESLGAFAGLAKQSSASAPVVSGPSYFDKALETTNDSIRGFNRGVESIVEGGVQGALKLGQYAGIDTEAPQKRLETLRDERIGTYNQAAERSPIAAPVSQFVGGASAAGAITGMAASAAALGSTVLPAVTMAGRAAAEATPLLMKVLGGSAIGALGSAALTHGTSEDRLQAGILGGALGALPGLVEGRGQIAKAILGDTDKVAARVANAASLGQSLTLGQATQKPGIMAVEKNLAEVPLVGTKGVFKTQLENTKTAIEDVATKLKGTGNSEEAVNAAYQDFADKAAQTNIPVPLNNVQSTLSDIQNGLKIGGKTFKNVADPKLQSIIKDLETIPQIGAQDISKLNNQLSGVIGGIRPDDNNSFRLAVTLKKAFQDDLSEYATKSNPEVIDSFNAAKNLNASKNTSELISRMVGNTEKTSSGEIDPLAFSKQISNNKDLLKNTITPENYQVLTGLQKFIQQTHTGLKTGASEASFIKGVVGAALTGLGWFNPLIALKAGVIGGTASKILTSPKTTALLMKMATTKPGTSAAEVVSKALLNGASIETRKNVTNP